MIELSKETDSIAPLLNKAVATLSCLDNLYEKADNKMKREIIGSIYPEKLVFDGFHYRTARLNEAVSLIYNVGKGFSENKKRQIDQNFDLSNSVTWIGFQPLYQTHCQPVFQRKYFDYSPLCSPVFVVVNVGDFFEDVKR